MLYLKVIKLQNLQFANLFSITPCQLKCLYGLNSTFVKTYPYKNLSQRYIKNGISKHAKTRKSCLHVTEINL